MTDTITRVDDSLAVLTGALGPEQYENIVAYQREDGTPNVPGIACQGFGEYILADEILRGIAQNLIDCIPEHRHLTGARVLLLVRKSDAIRKKIEGGGRYLAGQASKANPREQLLSRIGRHQAAAIDFVIWLSGDHLDRIEVTQARGEMIVDKHLDEYCEPMHKLVALIDHELGHCGAKILAEWVDPDKLDMRKAQLGTRYIETCRDVVGFGDRLLVRYYDYNDGYIFTVRKHDVEEFEGVAARHGKWSRQLSRLFDAIVKHEPGLFDGAEE